MIHQWFRESKIQVVKLPLEVHKCKANKTKLVQAVMQENEENGKLLVDGPRNRSENFPKSTSDHV